MPVFKRKYKSGEIVWSYVFSAPGASGRQITKSGFQSKKEAQVAEAERRIEEQRKYDLERSGAPESVAAELPKILAALLEEFFKQHCEVKNLSPKTIERYRENVALLAPELLAMPLNEIKPLQLTREWSRLLKSGGRHRRTKAPRPLGVKSVRNIAGTVSSAFGRAVKWGLVKVNPVAASELPKLVKKKKVALATAHQDLLVQAASGPWCMSMILEMDAATGARRGEVLALRWVDIENGRVTIGRSLCQTFRLMDTPKGPVRIHDVLIFKTTKNDDIRVIGLPGTTLAALEAHRKQQDMFRQRYGKDYRADLDLIFANPDGSPLKPDSVSSAVSALFKRLKIPKPKGAALHLIRHSHGSHLLAGGVPLPAVSARLGHNNVRTTAEIYAHEIHGQDDEAVRKWEEFQQKNRPQSQHPERKQ
jgi:integrase